MSAFSSFLLIYFFIYLSHHPGITPVAGQISLHSFIHSFRVLRVLKANINPSPPVHTCSTLNSIPTSVDLHQVEIITPLEPDAGIDCWPHLKDIPNQTRIFGYFITLPVNQTPDNQLNDSINFLLKSPKPFKPDNSLPGQYDKTFYRQNPSFSHNPLLGLR